MKRQRWSLTRTAAILLVLIAVTLSGCVDEPEEPVDRTAIYVYQEGFGEEGDPEEDISEFYTWASAESGGDEKAGEPVPVPVTRYAIEENPETGETSIYDSQSNLVDPKDIPDNWNDLIVKDEAGMPITDPSKFLHVERIGKNKYEIHGLAQEMENSDGEVWWRCLRRTVPVGMFSLSYTGRGPTKQDNILTIDGKHDEITGGFVRGEDGNDYIVMIFDEDMFSVEEVEISDVFTKPDPEGLPIQVKISDNKVIANKMILSENIDDASGLYNRYNKRKVREEIKKEQCTRVADGIYAHISKLPEKYEIYNPEKKNIDVYHDLALIAHKNSGSINTQSELFGDIVHSRPLADEQLEVHFVGEKLYFINTNNIVPIGKNKYEIKDLAHELEDPDGGVWRKVFCGYNDYMDEKLVDNMIGNKYAEITGGLILGEDGNVYGIIIANEKQFEIYGGDFGIHAGGDNERPIVRRMCHDTGRGLYMYVYNLSDLPEWNMSPNALFLKEVFGMEGITEHNEDLIENALGDDYENYIIQKGLNVHSPSEYFDEMPIAKKIGHYADFQFVKTES